MNLPALRTMILAGHPCVRIVTNEEPEVLEEVIGTAISMGLEPWGWTAVGGLKRLRVTGEPPAPGTENAAAAMVWLDQNVSEPVLLIMMDLADHLGDARTLRATKELIEKYRVQGRAAAVQARAAGGVAPRTGSCVVMVDHREDVPPSIGFLSARAEIPPPDDEELEQILRQTVARLSRIKRVEAHITRGELHRVVETLRGLTRRHAEQLVTEATTEDWSFTGADLGKIVDAKRRLLQDSGILEFVDAPTSMDEIGGLATLKKWLAEREASFHPAAASLGVTPPRGVMLLGVQGAGKSLSAKAIATAWKRPLMRLDPSALYDRFIGETEKRLRDALRQAEAMSPLVLWVDEIEKGFASAASTSTDGGLSRRLFGTMLNWMQEHRAPVFIVATANDIEALPPELLRKGRFDEIFFVDLPGPGVREQIFAIHLRRAKQDPAQFDLALLADAADGFSGAEIEQAVKSAVTREFGRCDVANPCPKGIAIDTGKVLEIVNASPPLSATMAEAVARLRAWAVGRCVPAD